MPYALRVLHSKRFSDLDAERALVDPVHGAVGDGELPGGDVRECARADLLGESDSIEGDFAHADQVVEGLAIQVVDSAVGESCKKIGISPLIAGSRPRRALDDRSREDASRTKEGPLKIFALLV